MREKRKHRSLLMVALTALLIFGLGVSAFPEANKEWWKPYIDANEAMLRHVREEFANPSVFTIYATPVVIIQKAQPLNGPITSQESFTFHHCKKQIAVGAGYAVREDGFVLSAGHIADTENEYKACLKEYLESKILKIISSGVNPQEIYAKGVIYTIKNVDDEIFSMSLVATDEKEDLALFKVDDKEVTLKPLALSWRTVFSDNQVAIIGAPRGIEHVITLGKVARHKLDEQSGHILIVAPVYPGNSGGPAITLDDFKVIGILSTVKIFNGSVFKQIMDVGTIVPCWKIRDFLERTFAKIDFAT